MKYIATFYSHFGAIRFKQICQREGCNARLMPVPRNLSSSCGTCVGYDGDKYCPSVDLPEEVEQIVEIGPEGYIEHYRAENG